MKSVAQNETSVIDISDAEIKKNQKRGDRKSAEDISIAVDYLAKIMEGLRTNLGRPPTTQEILDEMKRIGFEISRFTLWRYKGKIKKIQSSVRDLLEEGTYSAYFEHNMELLDYIEEQAIKCYNQKWTNSKKVSKQAYSKEEGIVDLEEVHTTEEIAHPKASFLNILTKVVDLRTKATNEDNLNLSCAMLSEEFQKTKDRADEFQRKNEDLEKELRQVLKKKRGKNKTSND